MSQNPSMTDGTAPRKSRQDRVFLNGVAAFAAVVMIGMIAFAVYVAMR